jgi:hypothetical protein
MDPGDSADAVLGAPGNVFYFVADLGAAAAWYSARLGAEPVTRALCQLLDPFGNLFGLRQPPA